MIRTLKPALSKGLVAPNTEEPQGPHSETHETFPALPGSQTKCCTMRLSGERWCFRVTVALGRFWHFRAREQRRCSFPRTLLLADSVGHCSSSHGFPCIWVGGRRLKNSAGDWSNYSRSQRLQRGAKLSVSCCTAMWERLSLALKLLSCYFNAGWKTTKPPPLPPPAPKICEILLLNLDSNIIQEMRMYSFIKVKGF